MIVFEVIGMGAKKYGGFEKYIAEEARQLKEKGHSLVVIFDREPLAPGYVEDLKKLGVSIEILPHKSKISFAKGFWQLMKKYHPKIVHTNFSSNVFIALPIAWLFGVKKRISTGHCIPTIDKLKNLIAIQLIGIIATNKLAVSKKSADQLKKALLFRKNKVDVLYLGVEDTTHQHDEARIRLGADDDIIALINIAYHNPVKGVDVLLHALHHIVYDLGVTNVRLYQIGGGQTGYDTEALRNLARDLKIEPYIEWMGLRNDVTAILPGGDIYIQPSRSEGISLSIMEASIASLPVVGTTVGGIPEAAVDNENALLVPPEEPLALAKAIVQLCNDPQLRSSFGRKGRLLALEKFCLTRNVTKLITDYYGL